MKLDELYFSRWEDFIFLESEAREPINSTVKSILSKKELLDVIIKDHDVTLFIQIIWWIKFFNARFPINIWGSDYHIVLTWETEKIKHMDNKYPERKHPFNQWLSNNEHSINFLRGGIIRSDITPDMSLSLEKDFSQIRTNWEFWENLRKRIPMTHPLSLIPIC
jgi:hypothetical protein